MVEPNQRLVDALAQLRAELDPVEPRLIGGLAVHLRCEQLVVERGLDPDLLLSHDPRRWPTVVRVTRDIDLVVDELRLPEVRQVLLDRDFERSVAMKPPPERYVRSRTVVDIIACVDLAERAGRPTLEEAVVALRAAQSNVAGWSTATLGALVVYKALARREKDWVDVARIALLDRGLGEVRQQIATLRRRLRPAFGYALRELGESFDHPDGRACGAFFREVEAALGFDAEGLEDPIREQASAAVGQLLGDAAAGD